MRIGIDFRMAGTGEGIARYAEELASHLTKIDPISDYYLIGQEGASSKFIRRGGQSSKYHIVETNSNYYSWAEQTRFIRELRRLRLDLMHFPSFNVPIFYPGKFVVTIHDIIHHRYPGKKKSRFFHRLAYRLTIRAAVKRAAAIIAVSRQTKQDIMDTFGISPDRVKVIYEGVEERFMLGLKPEEILAAKKKYGILKPYLLCVGVWRQYKNLPRLARAFDIIKASSAFDGELVLVGKIDPFYPEIRNAVFAARFAHDIKAPGYIPDDDLAALYQGADAFVIPSLEEGFGLIGIEAQAAGLVVAASDIPVLREVLADGAEFFDPSDERDMARKIERVLRDAELRRRLSLNAAENARKYSWEEAARQTLEVYKLIL